MSYFAYYDSTNYNGEGGIIHSFVLLFRSRKRASKDFLTMPKMETMMEKAGGITNRFVLFLGSGNQAGQNHQTMTKWRRRQFSPTVSPQLRFCIVS